MTTSVLSRPRGILRALFEAQRGICAGCGGRMPPFGALAYDRDLPSIDHVHARAAGGGDHAGNMLAMHRRCNSAKGDRPPTGCERIWHEAVRAIVDFSPFDLPVADASRATLGDVWPMGTTA